MKITIFFVKKFLKFDFWSICNILRLNTVWSHIRHLHFSYNSSIEGSRVLKIFQEMSFRFLQFVRDPYTHYLSSEETKKKPDRSYRLRHYSVVNLQIIVVIEHCYHEKVFYNYFLVQSWPNRRKIWSNTEEILIILSKFSTNCDTKPRKKFTPDVLVKAVFQQNIQSRIFHKEYSSMTAI